MRDPKQLQSHYAVINYPPVSQRVFGPYKEEEQDQLEMIRVTQFCSRDYWNIREQIWPLGQWELPCQRWRKWGLVDLSGWKSGERKGDEECPIVDYRDLGVDMETTAEWPAAGTGRVSENFLCKHTQTLKSWPGMSQESHSCIYACVCLSKDCLCLFAEQIQMYVAVGLQFQCHGLHCLFLCGG